MCLIVVLTIFTEPEQKEKQNELIEPILAAYQDVLGELPDGLPV
jgi:hypothetical protein